MRDRVRSFGARRLGRAFETGRILPFMFLTLMLVAFAFAAVMRIVDRTDFPTYGNALWWAVATITTVGYGDVVPKEPVGRVVAGVLMLLGFASLSLLTGIIASALVSRRRDDEVQQLERRVAELERKR